VHLTKITGTRIGHIGAAAADYRPAVLS
jgi:hypothetical protein